MFLTKAIEIRTLGATYQKAATGNVKENVHRLLCPEERQIMPHELNRSNNRQADISVLLLLYGIINITYLQ